jgi:glucose/arabinose dehydrogenase
MRRLVVIFVALFVFVLGGYFVYRQIISYYNLDPRFIKKVLEPPKQDIALLLKKGNDLNKPLTIADDFHIGIFADLGDFGMPRVLRFDDQGVLFTSLTKKGGVIALPDEDNNGVVDEVITVLAGLNKPHGIDFVEDWLYIAESDKVVRYKYNPGNYTVDKGEVLFSLPGGGSHYTRTINILEDKLYTSVGSSCDVCIENDEKRAAILVSDLDGNNLRVFASGLRNTVFFDFDKEGKMWGNDMGRDFLGNDLPPDELNIINEGSKYGWPRCYGKSIRDLKFRSFESLDYCKSTIPTTFDFPAHVAPLGLRFIDSKVFSSDEQGDLLVSFHGSWNASPPKGYKIVKLEIENNQVTDVEDFISGWLTNEEDILGRPVDLLFGSDGALYVSDDKAGVIYLITKN